MKIKQFFSQLNIVDIAFLITSVWAFIMAVRAIISSEYAIFILFLLMSTSLSYIVIKNSNIIP